MFDYVGIGKVEIDKVGGVRLYVFNDSICNFWCVYFWFEVVGGYFFWRRNQQVMFVFKWFFVVIVEEEGYVGVFFGFSDMYLCFFIVGKYFFQCV